MSDHRYAWCTHTMCIVDAHDLAMRVTTHMRRARPQHEFLCLDCGVRMYLHVTQAARYHVPGFFSHEASESCQRAGGGGAGESAEHYRCKHLLQKLAGRYKFLISACRSCYACNKWGEPEAGEVVIEKRAQTKDDQRYAYDAAVVRNGKVCCALEVYHTHKTTEQKITDTKKMGADIAEFDTDAIHKMHLSLMRSNCDSKYVLDNLLVEMFTCDKCQEKQDDMQARRRTAEELAQAKKKTAEELAEWRRELRLMREDNFDAKERTKNEKELAEKVLYDQDQCLRQLNQELQERSDYAWGRLAQIRSLHASSALSQKLHYKQILEQREAAYVKMAAFYYAQIQARKDAIKCLCAKRLDEQRQNQYRKAKRKRAENVFNRYPYEEGRNFKCICRRWVPLDEAVSVHRDCMTDERWEQIPSVVYKRSRGMCVQKIDGLVCMQCSIDCERCTRMFLLNDSLASGLCLACNRTVSG